MPGMTLIFGAKLIDGSGGPPVEDSAVLVDDGWIVRVGRTGEFKAPPGCAEVDATNHFLVPGFVDAHVHLTMSGHKLREMLTTPFSTEFFRAARNMHETLMAGVLTVRDAGGSDLGVKRAVEEGLVFGPRLQISISPLTRTGGYGDGRHPSGRTLETFVPHPGRPSGACDGVEGVIRKVREVLAAGADAIKVYASGGPRLSDRDPAPGFNAEELKAIVGEAAAAGVPVMAHAYADSAVRAAAAAGVASVEHGARLTDAAIEAMLKARCFLVPTLSNSEIAAANVPESSPAAAVLRDRAQSNFEEHLRSVGRAFRAGVPVAMGSDAGITPHGKNISELALLVRAGLTPMQALVAGTANGARLLGVSDKYGTIQQGKRADIVILSRDPLADASAAADRSSVALVMKDGDIVSKSL